MAQYPKFEHFKSHINKYQPESMGKSSDFFFLYFCIITLLPTNIQIKFHLKHRKFQKTVSERVKFDKWSDKTPGC